MYERIMQNQIYPYLSKNIAKYQCGFRKGFSAQHCIIAMIEKWRQTLNSGGRATAVLTVLSKAFDCIDYELLITKLNAYGFDNSSLTFIYSYLSERKQRTKIVLVVGQRYYLVYRKVQPWDHFYLTPIHMTCFLK